MSYIEKQPSRAQISRSAIQRLHISMRHLFLRGSYKPLGASGEAMINAMLSLQPEIYGSIANPERVELSGLLYIFQRLPIGIEQCRYVKLISREGLQDSDFEPIIPAKRRRNCYRIDEEQMFIEMTRGRSDIYDVLTHLTFMYIEAEKIRRNALDSKNRPHRDWQLLEEAVHKMENGEDYNEEVGYTYLSTLLGRSYEDVASACEKFEKADQVNNLFKITYHMGKLSMQEFFEDNDREISFSVLLRQVLGHHTYGERWAQRIKRTMADMNLIDHEIHIISANMHSVMNSLYAEQAIGKEGKTKGLEALAELLSLDENHQLRDKVKKYAEKHGMIQLNDDSGTNIATQIIDLKQIDSIVAQYPNVKQKIILVMDYAFGEQAYESMDELLKPYEDQNQRIPINVRSINIMGKAGILEGQKGDIMVPNAHVFEGSADNYPFDNELTRKDFENCGLDIYSDGPMITVLGTSLQNEDILRYFKDSSWKAIGLEMEGAHYQKAIQAASKIRNSVDPNQLQLRYAYYASDNPLETGATLASGSLGMDGVKPTYAITKAILEGIFNT